MIIGAVYMIRAVRVVMHGPLAEDRAYVTTLMDANPWRKVPYALLIASLLVFGFFPRLLTEKIKPVTEQIVAMATVRGPEWWWRMVCWIILTPTLFPGSGRIARRAPSESNAANVSMADNPSPIAKK